MSLLDSGALGKKGECLTRADIQLFVPENLCAMVLRLQRP